MAGRGSVIGGRDLRADFPLLARELGGRALVYLDSAATSQKPRAVLDAMRAFYERSNANVHRAVHRLGEEASEAYEGAREAVRRFVRAKAREEIVFTRGTTESINLVAEGWAAPRLRAGDEILVTELEHHSNLLPWQRVARRTGAVLRTLPVDEAGELRLDALDRYLGPRTRVVAMAHASGALGTILPVARLARAAREVGAAVVLDAAQAAPHLPLDVGALGCDFVAFSGHKVLGPTGVGVLWGTRARLEEMEPLCVGGGMVREVGGDDATWREPPWRFEAGTPPIAEAVGLRAAVGYLEAIGMETVRSHERELTAWALRRLADVPGVTSYGPADPDRRVGIVSFNLSGVHPHDAAALLDQDGICVRAGAHCAQPLMRRLGLQGTVRASFHVYSVRDDVEALASALENRGQATFSGG